MVWNSLIKNDIIYIPKNKKVINDILDGLLFASKSRLNTFKFCETVFKYGYILGIKVNPIKYYMNIGRNFHWIMENIYDYIDINKILELQNIKKYVYELIFKLIPVQLSGVMLDFAGFLAKNIAEYEDSKVIRIERIGLNKENLERYFYPKYRELGLENNITFKTGFIDAVYNIPSDFGGKDKLCVIDYKFGKPKYFNVDYNESFIKGEISFYKCLMEEAGAMLLDKKTKTMKIYNNEKIDYGMMVYFQDISTSKLFELNDLDACSLNEELEKYWKTINSCKFKQIYGATEYCMDLCPFFWDYCYIYEQKWNYLKASE